MRVQTKSNLHAQKAFVRPQDKYKGVVRRKRLTIILTFTFAIFAACLDLQIGSSNIGLDKVIAGLFGASDSATNALIQTVRLPHVLCAFIAGIALALSGTTLQGVLYNPLASPSTVGISQGAAFGASIAIVACGGVTGGFDALVFNNPYAVVLCAFIGACLSAVVILLLSRFRDLTPESIILAGVALSALFTGATALVQYFADDSQIATIVFWTFGSLRKAGSTELTIMGIVTLVCGVYFIANRWNYNALSSGESQAHNLGIKVSRKRIAGVIIATVCASTIIAFCGTINFIGLVAPHIMRRIIGNDFRFLIPASAFCGAFILLVSDILTAIIIPSTILPISAITSFIGAPFFIYLLLKGVRR